MKASYLIPEFRETVHRRFPEREAELNAAFEKRIAGLRADTAGASKEKRQHLENQILPGIAIYETLQTIPELKAFKPSANFVLVQILKEGVTSFDVFDNLIRQKLMIRDCSSFEQLDGEFIRFCIMSPEENTRLLYALKTFFSEN